MDDIDKDLETARTISDAPTGKPASAGALEPGDAVAGYIIGEQLGVGGFGVVYAAQHPVIGKDVAIKILHDRYSNDADAVARFVAEARAVNRIGHPGIVDIFDFGQLPDGRQFCVMERIRGQTLRQLLAARTRLPVAEALPILRAIAEAVDAAHGAGVAHRDLKPDNVFVVDLSRNNTASGASSSSGGSSPSGSGNVSGRVTLTKLIDFGLAKLTDADSKATSITRTGAMVGTPLYMSPEQCMGRLVDNRTDLYSFGALAYHVLTGSPPFAGEVMELALHHINDRPEPPSSRCPGLPASVDRVLLALLAKEPADRPVSLLSAVGALEGTVTLPPVRRVGRMPWRAIMGGAAVLLIAGLVIALVTRRDAGMAAGAGCEPSTTRLAGIWDAPIRGAVEARFAAVPAPAVATTWRMVGADLDDYATRWANQWDEACRSAEAETDLLLHAQRITCLENALLDLRGVTELLGHVEVTSFVGSWNGDLGHAALEDCATTSVLRAQVPAPTPKDRDEATRLMMEIYRTRAELATQIAAVEGDGDATRAKDPDSAITRLVALGGQLEAMGAAGANEAAAAHARAAIRLFGTDQPRVRKAIADAIARAERMRDDKAVAVAYGYLAELELDAAKSVPKADEALARAEAAADRAGRPLQVSARLRGLRAQVAMNLGRYEDALKLMREAEVLERRLAGPAVIMRAAHAPAIEPLLRLGRIEQAIAEARSNVTNAQAVLGDHVATADRMYWLAKTLAATGDVTAALAEDQKLLLLLHKISANPGRIQAVRMLEYMHALRLGRKDVVASARAGFARLGMPPQFVIAIPLAFGDLALERQVLEELSATPEIPAVAIADALAYVDFMTGDISAMEAHARVVSPAAPNATIDPAKLVGAPWIYGSKSSPWFLAIADATAGRRADAAARLRALAVAHGIPELGPIPSTLDGFVLAALGKWVEARAAFEHVRAEPLWATVGDDWSLAEIDAWLGVARLEAGDANAALVPLEESLATLRACCDGVHYFAATAELALARALWETGGDKQRARRLAEQARDHFSTLVHREPERLAAVRWIADHRATNTLTPTAP